MTGDWKPGDVALVDFTGLGDWRVATYDDSGRYANWWSGSKVRDAHMTKVRPLVVIDPEDLDGVSALMDAFNKARAESDRLIGGDVELLQEALRKVADPATVKPDEPHGLGAVVEDHNGDKWVRMVPRIADFDWFHAQNPNRSCAWRNLTAVRVLSEGVVA